MDPINWDMIERKFTIFLDKLGPLPIVEEDLDVLPYLNRMLSNSNDLMRFIDNITPQMKDKKNLSILLLVAVFSFIEGGFTYWVNSCIYQLIRKGHHDLWDDLRQFFVSSFDNVAGVRLAVKLKFLKLHGLDFIDRFAHRDLRNAFAHQNYIIDNDGNVITYKGRNRGITYSVDELADILESLRKLMEVNLRVIASKLNMEFDVFVELLQSLGIDDFKKVARKMLDEQTK